MESHSVLFPFPLCFSSGISDFWLPSSFYFSISSSSSSMSPWLHLNSGSSKCAVEKTVLVVSVFIIPRHKCLSKNTRITEVWIWCRYSNITTELSRLTSGISVTQPGNTAKSWLWLLGRRTWVRQTKDKQFEGFRPWLRHSLACMLLQCQSLTSRDRKMRPRVFNWGINEGCDLRRSYDVSPETPPLRCAPHTASVSGGFSPHPISAPRRHLNISVLLFQHVCQHGAASTNPTVEICVDY